MKAHHTFDKWFAEWGPMHHACDRKEFARAAWDFQKSRIAELEQRPAVTPEMVTRFRRVYEHDVCDGYGLRPESVRLALEQALAIGGGDE